MVKTARELDPDTAQLVRRAHKLLLRAPNTKLVRACNEFVSASNGGVAGDDLSDLLADLRDAFEDARRQAP